MTGEFTAPLQGGTALEATGLAKRYRGTWALRDCSLSIPAGRVVALVGPNGAGKSTFLRLAVGLIEATQGSVRVFGEPVGQRAAALARVAFLAQDKPLYDGFTVAEMLRFGRRLNPGGTTPWPGSGWRSSTFRCAARSAGYREASRRRSR